MSAEADLAGAGQIGTGTRGRSAKPGAKRVKGATLWFWVFVGPFTAGLLIFAVVPIIWGLILSFFESQNTVSPQHFVGFQNYVDMLKDSAFVDSLKVFTIFAIFIIPLTFALALFLAVLVNQITFMRTFFRSVFFLPTAVSYVVASLIWKQGIFNNDGLANHVTSGLGGSDQSWLSSQHPPLYWIPLVTVRLWLQLGFYMIIFLAGLQRISPDLYEAAYVDGATPGWTTFRFITFPQLRATSIAVVILNLIAAYQAFDEFYNLLGGANYGRPPLVYLYSTALGTSQQYGLGSAGAFILAIIIIIFTLIQGRIFGFGRTDD
ncbi:MAG: carbohydrate ABC transporter permease [Mycobacteriales bacterium]